MATCQKKIQTGTAVVECGRPAVYLCTLPTRYTLAGRQDITAEYRCEGHRDGTAVRLRGAA